MTLTSSQRINMIKNISSNLEKEDWVIIDLTLKEYGLPTSNMWNEDRKSYIVEMISGAADNLLIDLNTHVTPPIFSENALEDIGVEKEISPSFWEDGSFRVFISHLSLHKKFAADIQSEMLKYGISCFVAHSDIEPTLEWQKQIEEALLSCDSVVALLHEGFHSSNWTDQEIGFAMGRKIPVFSVGLGQSPYGFIGKFQAFSGSGKSAKELAEEIFNAYLKNEKTKEKMSEILVSLFERSSSYLKTRENFYLMKKITVWNSSFSSRIRKAREENPQISNCYSIKDEQISDFIQEMENK